MKTFHKPFIFLGVFSLLVALALSSPSPSPCGTQIEEVKLSGAGTGESSIPKEGILSLVRSLTPQSAAAGENAPAAEFEFINCDAEKAIQNKRLFFARSSHGFIYDMHTGSPLHENIPGQISTFERPPPGQGASASTVIVQKIPTKPLVEEIVEGNAFDRYKYVGGLIGAVFGWLIAPLFSRGRMFVAFLGFVAGMVVLYLAVGKSSQGDLKISVDNPSGESVYFQLNERPAVMIPAKCNKRIGLKEGVHRIRVTKTAGGEEIESFSLKAQKFRDDSGKRTEGHYIYNIGGRNDYDISHALYKPKR